MLNGFVFMHLNKLIMVALLGYQVVILDLKLLFKIVAGMLLIGRNMSEKSLAQY